MVSPYEADHSQKVWLQVGHGWLLGAGMCQAMRPSTARRSSPRSVFSKCCCQVRFSSSPEPPSTRCMRLACTFSWLCLSACWLCSGYDPPPPPLLARRLATGVAKRGLCATEIARSGQIAKLVFAPATCAGMPMDARSASP